MKSLIAILSVFATTAIAGPDFHSRSPRGDDLTASPGARDIAPGDDVTFAHDSAALDDVARTQLDSVARYLKQRREMKLVVEGYTDSTGDAIYNVDLARRRAEAARAHLVRRGIDPDRIVLAYFGESYADQKGNPLDRRIVLWASRSQPRELSKLLIEKHAIETSWTQHGTVHAEERTPTVVRITRR
jgi:outer membrane protein OmpA-like peptidoglycan-associated protein